MRCLLRVRVSCPGRAWARGWRQWFSGAARAWEEGAGRLGWVQDSHLPGVLAGEQGVGSVTGSPQVSGLQLTHPI